MARSMWKGAIQFGLVTIPVKLYLATESKYGVSFHMLHEKDLSRIQMKIFCPADEKVISRTDTVKGYEYAPEKYVVITDEDLEKVPLKTVRSIEIEQFTPPDESDGNVRFVKQAYYLEPDKIGRKAFYLLKQVLEDEELTAICKVVIKDREALAALDPFGKTMLLTTLHWPDEIRATSELDLPEEDFDFKPAELAGREAGLRRGGQKAAGGASGSRQGGRRGAPEAGSGGASSRPRQGGRGRGWGPPGPPQAKRLSGRGPHRRAARRWRLRHLTLAEVDHPIVDRPIALA